MQLNVKDAATLKPIRLTAQSPDLVPRTTASVFFLIIVSSRDIPQRKGSCCSQQGKGMLLAWLLATREIQPIIELSPA